MAETVYRNVWASEEVRSLILGIFFLSISFLLELIFLFFPNELQSSFLAFLYIEVEIIGGTPLLTIFHLITWGVMFFSTLLVYGVIREYAGGRTGLLEIMVLIIVFAIIGWLIFDEWFALLFIGVAALIFGYMYLALAE